MSVSDPYVRVTCDKCGAIAIVETTWPIASAYDSLEFDDLELPLGWGGGRHVYDDDHYCPECLVKEGH